METTESIKLTELSVGELRRRVRQKHSEARGVVSAQIDKQACLDILTGKRGVLEVIEEWWRQALPTALADKLTQADKQDQMIAQQALSSVATTDQAVEICGAELPVMGHPDTEAPDPNYQFDYWKATRKLGNTDFRHTIKDVIPLLAKGLNILMVGPPSVGKSSVIEQLARHARWGLIRFQCNRDVTVFDFVGSYQAKDGQTYWQDGPLMTALRQGYILLLDEVARMPAECSLILHGVLEHGCRSFTVPATGEIVPIAESFRVIATDNTQGYGDETGLNPSAQVQDHPFISRFDAVFHVDWMQPEHECALLQTVTGVSMNVAEKIAKFAADTRKAFAENTLTMPVDLRQTLAWCWITRTLDDMSTGFALTVLGKSTVQDAKTLAEVAQRHFGNEMGELVASKKEN